MVQPTLLEIGQALEMGDRSIPPFDGSTTPQQLANALEQHATEEEIKQVAEILQIGVDDLAQKIRDDSNFPQLLKEQIESTLRQDVNIMLITGFLGLGDKGIKTKEDLFREIDSDSNNARNHVQKLVQGLKPWKQQSKEDIIQAVQQGSLNPSIINVINRELRLGKGLEGIEEGDFYNKDKVIENIRKLHSFQKQESLDISDIQGLDEQKLHSLQQSAVTVMLLHDLNASNESATKNFMEQIRSEYMQEANAGEVIEQYDKIQQQYKGVIQIPIGKLEQEQDINSILNKDIDHASIERTVNGISRAHYILGESTKESVKAKTEPEKIVRRSKDALLKLQQYIDMLGIFLENPIQKIFNDYINSETSPEKKQILENAILMKWGIDPMGEERDIQILNQYKELADKPETPEITFQKQVLEAMHARGKEGLQGPDSELDQVLSHPKALARVLSNKGKGGVEQEQKQKENDITDVDIMNKCTLSVIVKTHKVAEELEQRKPTKMQSVKDLINIVANFFNKLRCCGVSKIEQALQPIMDVRENRHSTVGMQAQQTSQGQFTQHINALRQQRVSSQEHQH